MAIPQVKLRSGRRKNCAKLLTLRQPQIDWVVQLAWQSKFGWDISLRTHLSVGIPIKNASKMPQDQKERHRSGRIGWLRAAVLGANDGIVSTASLVLGVAAAQGTRSNVLVAGVAGLVAGGYGDGCR